jgi:Mg2+-importing ATPase
MNHMSPSTLTQASGSSVEKILKQFEADQVSGITSQEALERVRLMGPNSVVSQSKKIWWIELLLHFNSPLILLLLVASIISYVVAETLNATVILVMLLMSVLIDFFREREARNAAEKLQLRVKTKAAVLRDGTEKEVLIQELVPGDIVLLHPGKIIPADGRVLTSNDLFVDQSTLTGESFPAQKFPQTIEVPSEDLTAMENIVFMGSNVISGTGKVLVVNTGKNTEFGAIATKLMLRNEETSFGKGVKDFGYLIMKVTVLLVLFIFLINALRKQDILESFMFSIAVAVGLTPELLPMIMSLTMSKGSIQMAKKGVIVKHLPAIPNFGSMEVLCTDKTGTITEDRIRLIKAVDLDGIESKTVFVAGYLNSFFQGGLKNPLDSAMLEREKPDISSHTKVNEIPFDFYRKRTSVVVEQEGKRKLICKGAPEEVVKVCTIEKEGQARALVQYELLSRDGYRVLAVAEKNVETKLDYAAADEVDLVLIGYVAFLDPPKEDADEVVKALEDIGIEVKIITGDNRWVTENICNQIGLTIKGVLEGHEMGAMTEEALRKRVLNTSIFTRFSPDQKTRVIQAIRSNHLTVGYLGDGINDAPSLKAADVGISVYSATDVAKESADIILTQKDLLVLKDGIIEGRKTFSNTLKYVKMGISSNFGNMLSVAAATMFLPFLPMLPIQILINNFLYDASQISIPSDNVDAKSLLKPQQWDLKFIRKYMLIFGLMSSVFDLMTFWILYRYFDLTIAQFRTGWFMESLATQILVVFIIRTPKIPFFRSKPSVQLVISTLVLLAIGWALPYLPFAASIGFQALPVHILLYIFVVTIVYLVSVEFLKSLVKQ